MNILSIGNSFSQDAQRYLHGVAKADGTQLNSFNLYIGGCSLSTHYRNMLSDQKKYLLEMNGESTGFFVSIKEALLNRNWDIVTLQQVSNESPYYETYQPYLNKIVEFVRLCAPKAKIAIHQTWAYEQGSARLNDELGYKDQADMFKDVKCAYQKAADEINADLIIPSGEVFQAMLKEGFEKIHRDTFHASRGAGRYALALTWYKTLTGNGIENNSFCDFDEDIANEEIEKIKKAVIQVCKL